jgi:hypothetical protein
VCERSIVLQENYFIVYLKLGAKIKPVVGCTGRGEKERKRSAAKCTDRTVCFHLIYQETKLCGRRPRERVKHVYFVSLWLMLCYFLSVIFEV